MINTLKFILTHPLGKRSMLSSLGRYARWQIVSRFAPGPIVMNFVNNSVFLAAPGMTGITGNIYVGLHEFEDMSFILHYLREGDIFVDIGANVGSYTILASTCAGAHTIAFEPGEKEYKLLLQNISLNYMNHKVEARQEAVGAMDGETSFTLDLGCQNHIIKNAMSKNATDTITVKISRLDNALKGVSPSVMKIDVEGFESDVIEGAERTIAKDSLNCIIMEEIGLGNKYGYDKEKAKNMLQRMGFKEYTYRPFSREITHRQTACKSHNIIFIRNIDIARKRVKEAPPFRVANFTI